MPNWTLTHVTAVGSDADLTTAIARLADGRGDHFRLRAVRALPEGGWPRGWGVTYGPATDAPTLAAHVPGQRLATWKVFTQWRAPWAELRALSNWLPGVSLFITSSSEDPMLGATSGVYRGGSWHRSHLTRGQMGHVVAAPDQLADALADAVAGHDPFGFEEAATTIVAEGGTFTAALETIGYARVDNHGDHLIVAATDLSRWAGLAGQDVRLADDLAAGTTLHPQWLSSWPEALTHSHLLPESARRGWRAALLLLLGTDDRQRAPLVSDTDLADALATFARLDLAAQRTLLQVLASLRDSDSPFLDRIHAARAATAA